MVPACILLEHFAPGRRNLIFFPSAAAVVPLAGLLGKATEQLAARTLAAIALIVTAVFHHLAARRAESLETGLSLEIAFVLLLTYGLGLLFSLRTHRQYFLGDAAPEGGERKPEWTLRKSLAVLAASTAAIGWASEILAGSVAGAAQAMGMSSVFAGVIVLGIAGNAAEHTTAVLAARNNQMDLAVGIAIGSSIQIALFVAPVLVLASFVIGPAPMDLVFSPAEVLAIVLAVWIAGEISGDGESNWLEGVQLLAV